MAASQVINISGRRFGELTVTDQRRCQGNNSYWLCNCDCGKSKWIRLNSLLRGLTTSCGHNSSAYQGTNENGNRFGMLVLSNRRFVLGNVEYDFTCDCGKTGTVGWRHVKNGTTSSCGCSKRSSLGNNAAGRVWYNYRKNAKTRTIEFGLTEKQFLELIVQPCYYCGKSLTSNSKSKWGTGDFLYTGIDRLDSWEGYTVENCVPCCATCNRRKMALSVNDFASWIRDVYWNFYVGKMGGKI